MMSVFVFPGQGSQHKGMGADLFKDFEDLTAKADAVLGYSIKKLCLHDHTNQLNQTQYTQPALFVVNALSYLKRIEQTGETPSYLAGHSLGEYNALFAAGAFDFETGLQLVQRRAHLMAQSQGGRMAAVMGADRHSIKKVLNENQLAGIDLAAYNAPSQTVIAGPQPELEIAARSFAKMENVVFMPLNVSAAFHSRYMQNAQNQFAAFLDQFRFGQLKIPVISNVTADAYKTENIKQLLTDQLTHVVRWKDCIDYLLERNETDFVEIGPGHVLSGLIEKIKDGLSSIGSKTDPASEKKRYGVKKPFQTKNPVLLQQEPEFKDPFFRYREPVSKREKWSHSSPTHRSSSHGGADIAIIGMACRFPGAHNYHGFWENLENGINAIREITPDRWDINKYYSEDIDEPNKSVSKWCGLIEDIDKFDNRFFNISPREAKNMDPQQRLLLQETWRCIEDSGVPLEGLQSKKTAVYIGVMASDYRQEVSSPGVLTDSYAASGNYDAILANRISYALGFTGASVSIDAACASSLVALNDAKRSLVTGESDYAVSGGVSLNLHPWKYISFSKARMLSPDGQCKTFDADANGYVPGEGVGVLLLQRLEDAVSAGNHIYAVVKGSAVNHGGQTRSLTAPRVEAQQDVILEAYKEAGFSPRTVTYVEAHGTGTSLGDPIEVEALTRSFNKYTHASGFCKIGSVKTNIGHLEAAAGVAGIIKVLLMMKRRKIPRTLNIRNVNPIIRFSGSPFTLAEDLSGWQSAGQGLPLRAGVSSFGMGGVNAHVLFEQYDSESTRKDTNHSQLFLLSAKTKKSLQYMLSRWKKWVSSESYSELQFRDICWTMLTGRKALPYRLGFLAVDKRDLKQKIIDASSASIPERAEKLYCLRIGALKIENYAQIKILFEKETIFSECFNALQKDLDRLSKNCRSFKDVKLLQELRTGFKNQTWTEHQRTVYAFMTSYCMVAALNKIGAGPGMIAGENQGVLTSLAASGIIKPIDALSILAGQKKIDHLELIRPKIPFFNPDTGQTIKPYHFSEEYVRFIRKELHVDDGLFSYYIDKAQLLFNSQFTFKRYLQEWNGILSERSKEIEQMLFEGGTGMARRSNIKREKQLLIVIIISSLRKLHLKWDLTQNKPIVDQLFSELIDLVVDGVMTQKVLVEFMLADRPDAKAIALSLCKRHRFMDAAKPYKFIRTQNHHLKEVGDPSLWFDRISTNLSPLAYTDEMAFVAFGNVDPSMAPQKVIPLQAIGDLKKIFKQFLLRLWLEGVHVEWGNIFKQGAFTKAPLPGYAFNRKSFWLHSKEKRKLAENSESENPKGFKNPAQEPATTMADTKFSSGHLTENPLEKGTEISDKLLLQSSFWKHSKILPRLPHKLSNYGDAQNILIFGTDEKIRRTLASKTADYMIRPNLILVKPDRHYRDLDQFTYGINPGHPEDFQILIETLKRRKLEPQKIIHMWSEMDFKGDGAEFESQLAKSVYALYWLTRELVRQHVEGRISLLYLFMTHAENVQPHYAAVEGLVKTIRLENPRLLFKTLEIDSGHHVNAKADSKQLCDTCLLELQSAHMNEAVVRYKGAQRLVKRYKRIDLAGHYAGTRPLKPGGVYLITGGTGGLGLIFAEHLAKRFKATIVLCGRFDLTPEKSTLLNNFQDTGSQVVYIKSDITRQSEVNDLIAKIKSRFNAIHGVIHAAGVIRDAYLINKRPDEMDAVLAPKVLGALHMDKALICENLDFFILFSSTVAVTGNLGQSDYAYANSFLDNFARWREKLRQKKKRTGKTLSINWPLWQAGGMQMPIESQNLFVEMTGSNPLPTMEGLKCFHLALQSDLAQCIVGFGRKNKAASYSTQDKPNRETGKMTDHHEVDRKQIFAKTEQYLRTVIAELIEVPVDELDSQVSFEEYGIDSIMVHHFNARVERHFNSISKTLLFEYQNIEGLTNFMARNHETDLIRLFGMAAAKPLPQTQQEAKPFTEVTQKPATINTHNCNQPQENRRANEIAIIGLSGSYPAADTLEKFWHNLKSGKDCVTEIPENRWNVDRYFDPRPENAHKGKLYCKWGAFLDDVEMFDPLFFKISPREAELMDPQERLFLETAWKTFEDAGYTSRQIEKELGNGPNGDVGVFVGVTTNSYPLLGPQYWKTDHMPIPTSFPWSIANRVSYIFNFNGPSMTVDTACASSLTAVHMACQSILNGECQMALAGGVNLYLHPAKYVWLCQMRMISPTGRCASFGDGADGFVPGEGVGAVLLKPLAAAMRDNDNIYAVIKGSAINHGGLMHGYTVPNPNAQADLVSRAMQNARVSPKSISCIEAHGTGTELGDPVEIAGLTKAFGKHTDDRQFCSIGSAKSNIGHLEAAAGIAGLTKVVLQLKNRQLVPSLNSKTRNPNIDFKNSPFYVQQTLTPWKRQTIAADGTESALPRRAGISSFGAGGTNVHVIVEEYDQAPVETDISLSVRAAPQLIVLSAQNEDRLKLYAQKLLDLLNDGDEEATLENIAYTLQVGRRTMATRLALLTESKDELRRQLKGYLSDPEAFHGSSQVIANNNEQDLKTVIHDFAKGKFGKDFVELVLAHRDLKKIALLWVSGADIPWYKIHRGQNVRRISLPTYPFDRKPYWVSGTMAGSPGPDLDSRQLSNPASKSSGEMSGLNPKPKSGKIKTWPCFDDGDCRRTKSNRLENKSQRPETNTETRSFIHATMQQKLKQWVSKLLKVPEAKIEADHNLQEYGFDSLNAMRLIHRIEEHYAITLKPVHIYEHNTVEALAGFMQTQLKVILPDDKPRKDDFPDVVPRSQPTASHMVSLRTAMDVDKLPVGQVDSLLSQILNGRFGNVHCDECGSPRRFGA